MESIEGTENGTVQRDTAGLKVTSARHGFKTHQYGFLLVAFC